MMTKKLLTALMLLSLSACNYFESDASRLEKAETLYAQNDFKTAEIVLKKYLQNNPEHGEARHLLGKIYFSRFKLVDALEAFRRAKVGGYHGAELFTDWTRILLYKNDFAALDTLLADPDFATSAQGPYADQVRGDYHFLKREGEAARQYYDKYYQASGDQAAHCFAQVKLLSIENKHQALIEKSRACERDFTAADGSDWRVSQYLRALAQYQAEDRPAATQTLTELLDNYNDHKDPYIRIQASMLLMRLHQSKNNIAAAEALANSLLQYVVLAELYYVKGLAARIGGNLENAEALQVYALKLDPKYEPALKEMANIMFLRGNPEQAKYYAGKLDAAAGGNTYVRRIDESLAMNLFRQGDMDRVIASLSNLNTTGSAQNKYLLALAHARKKQTDAVWRVYADLQKELPDAKSRDLVKANLHTELGDYGRAEAIYVPYAERKDVQALMELSQLYHRQNNFARAEQVLLQAMTDKAHADKVAPFLARHYAISQQPEKLYAALLQQVAKNDTPATRLLLAKSYFRFGRFDDALAQADRVLKAAPDNIEAMLVQGLAQAQKKNYAQAEAALNKVLALEPKATNIYMLLA
ncbi:MAG: tetratricopeptide repeat protein, partial [Gammaproteobacteria bacterium]